MNEEFVDLIDEIESCKVLNCLHRPPQSITYHLSPTDDEVSSVGSYKQINCSKIYTFL